MKLKSIAVLLLLMPFCLVAMATDVDNDNEKDKTEKVEKKPELPTDTLLLEELKLDSLKDAKNNEKKVEKKKEEQPSLSTLSFNIIFQMIYRFSFSEIFDTSMGSGTDMEGIRILD